jgi:excisionase family DNA binding protein
MENSERPLGPAELAKALGCSRHTVDCAIKSGTIPAVRIGRRFFIPRRVVIEILDNGRIPQPWDVKHEHRTGLQCVGK